MVQNIIALVRIKRILPNNTFFIGSRRVTLSCTIRFLCQGNNLVNFYGNLSSIRETIDNSGNNFSLFSNTQRTRKRHFVSINSSIHPFQSMTSTYLETIGGRWYKRIPSAGRNQNGLVQLVHCWFGRVWYHRRISIRLFCLGRGLSHGHSLTPLVWFGGRGGNGSHGVFLSCCPWKRRGTTTSTGSVCRGMIITNPRPPWKIIGSCFGTKSHRKNEILDLANTNEPRQTPLQ